MQVAIVEDDPIIAKAVSAAVSAAGHQCRWFPDGSVAGKEALIASDLVILDLMLPGEDGLSVLKAARAGGVRTPVIVLTARGLVGEKLQAFEAGADDYLGKPFHVEELLARIGAVLRRRGGQAGPAVASGNLRLDEDRQAVVLPDGESVPLTGTEFRLLRCFMLNPDRILSKTRLIEHVYDQDFDRDSNLIEVYVRRLREKVGRDRILTRKGQGYVFTGAGP